MRRNHSQVKTSNHSNDIQNKIDIPIKTSSYTQIKQIKKSIHNNLKTNSNHIISHKINHNSRVKSKQCYKKSLDLYDRNKDVNKKCTNIINNRQQYNNLNTQNQQLKKQNNRLRQEYCQLQNISLNDKEKIKALLLRISQIKRGGTSNKKSKINDTNSGRNTDRDNKTNNKISQNLMQKYTIDSLRKTQNITPYKVLNGAPFTMSISKQNQPTCHNPTCEQKKKYLEIELYKQRIRKDQLQNEKIEWEKNKNHLKSQYKALLAEIKVLKTNSDV